MSGPFADVVLTTGDYFTQTRQRQMNTNSKMAWERTADGCNIAYGDYEHIYSTSLTPYFGSLRLLIDGAVSASVSMSASGDKKLGDISISALPLGLHTIQITFVPGYGAAAAGPLVRFVKHQYMDRLTVWASVFHSVDGETETIRVYNISIINHESAEGW